MNHALFRIVWEKWPQCPFCLVFVNLVSLFYTLVFWNVGIIFENNRWIICEISLERIIGKFWSIISSGLHSMPCSTDNPCRGALVVETTVRACTCSYPGTHSQLKMGVHLPRNSADANQSNESCKLTRSKSRVWLSFDWFAPAHSAVNVAWAGNTANKIKKNFVSSTNALTMNDKILQYTAVHHTTVGKRYKAI